MQEIFHIGGQPADIVQSQISAVILYELMCRHIVEMLGGADLGRRFSAKVDAAFLDQFYKMMELGRDKEGIDRIAE